MFSKIWGKFLKHSCNSSSFLLISCRRARAYLRHDWGLKMLRINNALNPFYVSKSGTPLRLWVMIYGRCFFKFWCCYQNMIMKDLTSSLTSRHNNRWGDFLVASTFFAGLAWRKNSGRLDIGYFIWQFDYLADILKYNFYKIILTYFGIIVFLKVDFSWLKVDLFS